MPLWEYMVIDLGAEALDDGEGRAETYADILNSAGADGWELVAVTETEYMDETDPDEAGIPAGSTIAYLKRERL